jgi:hypothetical protein
VITSFGVLVIFASVAKLPIEKTKRSQVEFGRSASFHVRRVTNGKPSAHPLPGAAVFAPNASTGAVFS